MFQRQIITMRLFAVSALSARLFHLVFFITCFTQHVNAETRTTTRTLFSTTAVTTETITISMHGKTIVTLTTEGLPSPTEAMAWGSGSGNYSRTQLNEQSLNSTNFFRKQFEAKPLIWDATLAQYGQRYAEKCIWEHSVRSICNVFRSEKPNSVHRRAARTAKTWQKVSARPPSPSTHGRARRAGTTGPRRVSASRRDISPSSCGRIRRGSAAEPCIATITAQMAHTAGSWCASTSLRATWSGSSNTMSKGPEKRAACWVLEELGEQREVDVRGGWQRWSL